MQPFNRTQQKRKQWVNIGEQQTATHYYITKQTFLGTGVKYLSISTYFFQEAAKESTWILASCSSKASGLCDLREVTSRARGGFGCKWLVKAKTWCKMDMSGSKAGTCGFETMKSWCSTNVRRSMYRCILFFFAHAQRQKLCVWWCTAEECLVSRVDTEATANSLAMKARNGCAHLPRPHMRSKNVKTVVPSGASQNNLKSTTAGWKSSPNTA